MNHSLIGLLQERVEKTECVRVEKRGTGGRVTRENRSSPGKKDLLAHSTRNFPGQARKSLTEWPGQQRKWNLSPIIDNARFPIPPFTFRDKCSRTC